MQTPISSFSTIPILILDFGSQYTQLIARRVRELGVYCEIFPFDIPAEVIESLQPQGIILSGGPQTVTTDLTPRAPEIVWTKGIPVLGICYGMQTMAAQCGGAVEVSQHHEFGHTAIELKQPMVSLFERIDDHVTTQAQPVLDVWMSHGDRVKQIPPGFSVAASSKNCPIAAIADEQRKLYGLQFHPEVTHTPQGQRLLKRFVIELCGCETNWQPVSIIEHAITDVQQQVGDAQVVLGLSGGVDSSVTAALLHRAIGDQLHCIFVDHGLLRQDEAAQVMAIFSQQQKMKVTLVEARERFLKALKGISDPEEKRKIIGQEFIRVFEEEAKKIPQARFLAQGTIYPDVVESAATRFGQSAVIKSHHNVGGLPERMDLQLVEPLRELFKDEVRQLGLELGLPHDLVFRHPFPGPGLAVRILGEIKSEYIELLQQADAIYLEELHAAGWYERTAQAFAVFLPVKAVGVTGDVRRYEYVIALRAVETSDYMTAHWSHLPYELLGRVANRIMNEIRGIARVTYDISSKPPATIEWE